MMHKTGMYYSFNFAWYSIQFDINNVKNKRIDLTNKIC